MVLELMGRDAGFIALHAGISGGADVILIPEIPFHLDAICKKIQERVRSGSHFSIVAIAEGARPYGKEQVFSTLGNELYAARLGGIGNLVGKHINDFCGIETRVIVLGHLQRGGSPTAFDRQLATRLGSAAVRLALNKGFGRMVALQGNKIVDISLEQALSTPKRVDLRGDTLQTARSLGIALGDENPENETHRD